MLIYRELAIPVMDKLSSLLLRSGAYGFWQFQRRLSARCSQGNTSHNPCRINPEDLKGVLYECGVQLADEEHKQIVRAYCDDIGFVLVSPFFDALCPALRLPEEQLDCIARIFPPMVPEKKKEVENNIRSGCCSNFCSGASSPARAKNSPIGESSYAEEGNNRVASTSFSLADVSLESLFNAFLYYFAPADPPKGSDGDDGNPCSNAPGAMRGALPSQPPVTGSPFDEDSISRALQVCYEEGALIFKKENYPQDKVPAIEAMNFLAAELLLHQHSPGILSVLVSRLRNGPEISAAPIAVIRKTKQGKPIFNPIGYSMVHTGLRWQRLFERYMNEDRRDEWLRGREERNARPTYMRHTCGFAGHLPEYKRHFGRTFHVIEENLPILSKLCIPIQTCDLRPDRFGPGRELKNNRNVHHYRLA